MSKKSSNPGGSLPANLPEDFFDTNKKSERAQEDELVKELEQFEQEMAAFEAESEAKLKDEFERFQEEKNIDELDQQMEQWKRIVELEKKAEELQNKTTSENPTKKIKTNNVKITTRLEQDGDSDNEQDLDDIEDFEDKLFNWRSQSLGTKQND